MIQQQAEQNVYRHFCGAEEWLNYRFGFSGTGVHGMPRFSGRSVRILGLPITGGLRLRLKFARHCDHESRTSGSWEALPGAARMFHFYEEDAQFFADLVQYRGPDSTLSIQALNEKTIYLDLQQEGGLLFSGKAARAFGAQTLRLMGRAHRISR